MARFKASSSEPADTTGVATIYTYCAFIDAAVADAARRAKATQAAAIRGHLNNLEDTA